MLGSSSVKVRTTGLTRRKRVSRWMRESPITYWFCAAFIALLMAGIVIVLLPASWFHADSGSDGAALPPAEIVRTDNHPPKCAEQAPAPRAGKNALLIPAWEMIGTTPTPYSATGGPVLKDTPRQCFTHSEEGAVYAAATVLSELSSVEDPDLRLQLVKDRVSHSGNYSKMLDGERRDFTAPTLQIQYVGYQIVKSTDETVQLDLATRPINGSNAGVVNAISFTMVWERNDWLLVAPPATGLPLRSLTDFTGFTPWGQAG
jgi:hypothetical protein